MEEFTEIKKAAFDAFKRGVLAVHPEARFSTAERLREPIRGILEEYGDEADLADAQAWVNGESSFEVEVIVKSSVMGEAHIQAVAQDVLVKDEVYIVPLVAYLEP